MHEMTLMGEVREIVVQAAKAHKFKRVKRVVLEIGRLSGVQVEAMRFCFDVVMEGTPAAEATLEIEELPGRAWCNHCEREVEITSRIEPCPQCHGMPGRILGGTEMRVKGLEVE
ncbi:MAG TPA: hydrogenase maturation nickel metallochaperone HypA [Holophaga sp.]|nr:hydrogenase maturation nickel metallochaperone HypA [Holophaga sp.]